MGRIQKPAIFQDAENGDRLWRGKGQVEKINLTPALPEELAGFRVFAFAEHLELLQLDLSGQAEPLCTFAHPEALGFVILVEVIRVFEMPSGIPCTSFHGSDYLDE